MLVKVAPLGERVVEVNVEPNSTIKSILDIAEVSINGRSIRLNNVEADEDTLVADINGGNITVITLATKMKGGLSS